MGESSKTPARRVDAWAVGFALVFPSLATWLYFIGLADSGGTAQQVSMLAGKVIQFAFPLAWVLVIRRQKFAICLRPRGGLEGLASGLLILATILAGYHLWFAPAGYLTTGAAEITAKLSSMGVRTLPAYVALGVFYSLIHSFLEEYYWRWFVYGKLRQLIPVPAAIVVSSLGFMAHHVIVLAFYFGWFSLQAWLFSLAVAAAGALWAANYQRSGSLLGPWLSHALADAAIFLVGYRLAQTLFG
jgi:membrane protease YdiL (CAAX protease family)